MRTRFTRKLLYFLPTIHRLSLLLPPGRNPALNEHNSTAPGLIDLFNSHLHPSHPCVQSVGKYEAQAHIEGPSTQPPTEYQFPEQISGLQTAPLTTAITSDCMPDYRRPQIPSLNVLLQPMSVSQVEAAEASQTPGSYPGPRTLSILY